MQTAPASLHRIYIGLWTMLVLLLAADIMTGTALITPFDIPAIWRQGADAPQNIILFYYRIPKSITAMLAGVALSVSGLQMQTVFRNPLADPYILGVSAGAGLGVALFLLGAPFLPLFAFTFGQAFAAWAGAAAVMLLLLAAAARIRDIMAILVLGVVLGSAIGALITLLQYFGQAAALKAYALWTMGSVGNTTGMQLAVLSTATFAGSIAAAMQCKTLNVLALGDDYARTLGYRTGLIRACHIMTATLLTGSATAFCGPIGFVGIVVPHIARMLCHTADNRILLSVSMLLGACIMLLCDILTQMPAYAAPLPINTITALLGIPVVALILFRNQKTI